jgi:putative ABC transport system permease protein
MDLIINILEHVCMYAPLMVGAYISFSLMKVPNLSIEAAFVSGAIAASKMLALTQGMSICVVLPLVLLASIVGGVLVGVLIAALDVYGKVPHLLASILTLGLCFGANLLVLGVANVSVTHLNNPLTLLPFPTHPELGMFMVIAMVVLVLGCLFLKTQLGTCLAVYGNNPGFFAHYGISTPFVVVAGLILSNALVGLSGYLTAQSNGFVDLNAGAGVSLYGITILILGKTAMKFVKGATMLIPLTGLVLYAFIQQSLLALGANMKYFTAIQSLIVLVLLVVNYRRKSAHELVGDHLGV